MKLAFTLEYDGTNFSGFQKQNNAITIQEHIENALKNITGSEIKINYSGRTDAGVHALSQVFDFDTNINGGYRAIVPIGVFDEVNPFDIDPTLFLKSLAIGDLVALRELGIFDLSEEDMRIFSYVCPSKYDYVSLFNDCMRMIWKEETS